MTLRVRVSVVFLIQGLVVATWVSRIPQIQTALKLSPGILGLVLLAAAAGSLASMPLTGWLIDREGSGRVSLVSGICFCLTLPLLALAPCAIGLAAALFAFGAAAGAMDVAMNAQAVFVEDMHGRSLMSSFHALFSAGGMFGATLGGFAAARGVPPRIHFFMAAAAFLLLTVVSARGLAEDHRHAPAPVLSGIPRRALALAAVAFIFFLTEGAIADWSAIYLREFLAAGPGTAAMAYALFSVVMTVGRLGGDPVIDWLGTVRTLRVFSLIAAAGLALVVLAQNLPIAFTGFALVAAGCCVIVPVAFAAAGRVPGISKGVGLAGVTGAGYFGLLAGPPMIGFTAQWTNLRLALLLLVALTACTTLLARGAGPRAS